MIQIKDENMNCPKCRRVQYFTCGDKTCVCHKRIPKNKKPQIHLKHDGLKCPYCGFVAHIDYWEERDMEQAERKMKT